MQDENLKTCDDLLRFAANVRIPELRNKLLTEALSHLDSSIRQSNVDISIPLVLTLKYALEFDKWALYPKLGDSTISHKEYLDIKRSIIESESKEKPILPIQIYPNRVYSAFQDVWNRYGIDSVYPFLKECWADCSILSEDDFFWCMVIAIRSEAFGLAWSECLEELAQAQEKADKNSDFLLIGRSRELAEYDKKLSRSFKTLATIAKRETFDAEGKLQHFRSQSYSNFIRGLLQLKPIYYTLRDVWYELHFLTDDTDEKSDFEFHECFVEERQADIGQLVKYPQGSPIFADMREWLDISESRRKRRLKFWQNSRVQVNDEIADRINQRIPQMIHEFEIDKTIKALQNQMLESLDPGQMLAVLLYKKMINEQIFKNMDESK